MTVLAWDPARFDVGVSKMNAQHENLVGLMNLIHDRSTAGGAKAELDGLLKKLAEATVAHFADEEAYLVSVSFADLKSHKLIHQKLLTDFTAHKARFDAGRGELDKGFFEFLSLWLRSHICHVDAKYNPRPARKAG